MNNPEWIKTDKGNLPNHLERITVYVPGALNKCHEMTFIDSPHDVKHFAENVSYWTKWLIPKPEENNE